VANRGDGIGPVAAGGSGLPTPTGSSSASPSVSPPASPSGRQGQPQAVPGCPLPAGGHLAAPRRFVPTKDGQVHDNDAHLTYAPPNAPWQPIQDTWNAPGMRFGSGAYVIAQRGAPSGDYYATLLSGTVAAEGNPTGCQADTIATVIQGTFYPGEATRQNASAKPLLIPGEDGSSYGAYLIRYVLRINARGYNVRTEQVSILVINTGRPQLSIVYGSIPDLVRQYNNVPDQTFATVRVQ